MSRSTFAGACVLALASTFVFAAALRTGPAFAQMRKIRDTPAPPVGKPGDKKPAYRSGRLESACRWNFRPAPRDA